MNIFSNNTLVLKDAYCVRGVDPVWATTNPDGTLDLTRSSGKLTVAANNKIGEKDFTQYFDLTIPGRMLESMIAFAKPGKQFLEIECFVRINRKETGVGNNGKTEYETNHTYYVNAYKLGVDSEKTFKKNLEDELNNLVTQGLIPQVISLDPIITAALKVRKMKAKIVPWNINEVLTTGTWNGCEVRSESSNWKKWSEVKPNLNIQNTQQTKSQPTQIADMMAMMAAMKEQLDEMKANKTEQTVTQEQEAATEKEPDYDIPEIEDF
jgi:hypothetical protein